jgi:hypothetical protein
MLRMSLNNFGFRQLYAQTAKLEPDWFGPTN